MRFVHCLFTLAFLALPAQAKYGGGAGEPNDPYLIYTAEQMNEIGAASSDWDKHFKLMADIDLGIFPGGEFNIIGLDRHNSFRGVFDGNGHTISNLAYNSADTDHIGLFGYVKGDAQISNLGLIDPNIDAGTGDDVGGLVGYFSGGLVSCCCVRGGRVCGNLNVGGLVGYSLGDIRNCYSSTEVSAVRRIGGLVGSHLGRIVKSYSTSVVRGSSAVGGLLSSVCDEWGCYSPTVTSFWDVETSGQDISAAGTP